MQNFPQANDLFDVYYDVNETLFDRIRELMNERSDDLTALKTIRDHVVRTVAVIENVTPESIYSDLDDVRTIPTGAA